MSLRSSHTSCFELLVTHEELADTLEALASTGSVELEQQDYSHLQMDMQDLQSRMQEYSRQQRYYRSLWPTPDTGMSPFSGSPAEVLDKALDCIRQWESNVRPQIHRLDLVNSRLANLQLLQAFLGCEEADELDFSLLSTVGGSVTVRLYLQANNSRNDDIPDTVLWKEYHAAEHQFLLMVGTTVDLDSLSTQLIHKKYTLVPLPALPASREDALHLIAGKQAQFKTYQHHLKIEISALTKKFHLAQALGEIHKMEWFLQSIPSLAASKNLVWLTGWTSDKSGNDLARALSLQGSRALLYFPEGPKNVLPPLVMQNPWWAKPFEIFASMLGTPGANEVDPTRMLAIMVPLLFGYMFGDVGQGFVLTLCGVLLHKRWPLLRILIVNGISAMLFGFVFGSVFGRVDLIPALWLHPISQPLPVLAVPLAAGMLIVLLGLAFFAIESGWRGEWRRWLQIEVPVILLYLAVIALFIVPQQAAVAAMCGLTWYVIANFILADGRMVPVLGAIGSLLETLMQLFLNTLSFVRVGAFALAHAGLSMAFNIMADSVNSMFIALLIMLLGNIIVIALEGLVVSIQTTRLILFEFFIRFLQADGRVFKPLTGPLKNGPGIKGPAKEVMNN
jgi:V/A-type H+/Na+-transporting ATPase subunit I